MATHTRPAPYFITVREYYPDENPPKFRTTADIPPFYDAPLGAPYTPKESTMDKHELRLEILKIAAAAKDQASPQLAVNPPAAAVIARAKAYEAFVFEHPKSAEAPTGYAVALAEAEAEFLAARSRENHPANESPAPDLDPPAGETIQEIIERIFKGGIKVDTLRTDADTTPSLADLLDSGITLPGIGDGLAFAVDLSNGKVTKISGSDRHRELLRLQTKFTTAMQIIRELPAIYRGQAMDNFMADIDQFARLRPNMTVKYNGQASLNIPLGFTFKLSKMPDISLHPRPRIVAETEVNGTVVAFPLASLEIVG